MKLAIKDIWKTIFHIVRLFCAPFATSHVWLTTSCSILWILYYASTGTQYFGIFPKLKNKMHGWVSQMFCISALIIYHVEKNKNIIMNCYLDQMKYKLTYAMSQFRQPKKSLIPYFDFGNFKSCIT